MSDESSSNVPEPLYQVRLLSALRSGDSAVIHKLLSEIGRYNKKSADDGVDIGAAALHLAIRCASCETIGLLLSHRSISPNAISPRGSGTTALHLAASIGRADVVNLLLEQEGIDDSLKDAHGRTYSRTLLTASYRSLLHSYIASALTQGPPQALRDLLHSPRAHLIDFSYLDPTTGRSLLHEAARRKDLSLIDMSIKAGADVFVRDRRGRAVGEGGGSRDDKVRVFLRQFTNQDTSLLNQANSSTESPALKGYLSKYTNVARGYNTRWFVLKNGVLSYYRHQDDENIASRGSIAMKSAILKYNSSTAALADKLRFEVHSTPGRGQQKWYIKGNHTVEVARWTQAIARSIEFARRDGSSGQTQSSVESDTHSLKSVGTSFRTSMSNRRISTSAGPTKDSSLMVHDRLDVDDPKEVGQIAVSSTPESGDEDADVDERLDDSSSETRSEHAPYESDFALHGNSAAAQAELTAQLLSSLSLPRDVPPALHDIREALEESAYAAARMVSDYVHMAAEREEWWHDTLARERARGALWEESLQAVVQEGAALENELKKRRGSKMPTDVAGDGGRSTIRRRSDAQFALTSPPFALQQPPVAKPGLPTSFHGDLFSSVNECAEPSTSDVIQNSPTLISSPLVQNDTESAADTDDEDEFFDAIESNLLQNVVVSDAFVNVPVTNATSFIELGQYEGYKNLRERLPIESDTRPPTSLWSVLKHSIGKDLTKISFPVFFNEPTSMLQRMAEDMEFSECLDAASVEPDPLKRIAFVAAFAMSNYSSTIGRIAKPFNPMLGETFEYVRLDKHYRYMSEQVSHHPPISACWAESPSWHYFGEVDAQNKFMGKSFEIRPTGIAHAELIIPESFGGPDYPKADDKMGKGKVKEHYSWKKVTTNVSGFIIGSPTIDHYGDMTVTNHRTGDTCVLTFKPRGWRGKDAFEILGHVMDANGSIKYEIAGRWNSQLVARAVGTGFGVLHPDVAVRTPASPSLPNEFILLWRNTTKPSAPFNLTPFAITLNDLPEQSLRPYICPTDCRLRPDQRAFELGKYERANELKGKQEEFQRMTRRAREEGRMAPHKPRWFEAKTEPETGERVWEPARVASGDLAYWHERETIWRQGAQWNDSPAVKRQSSTETVRASTTSNLVKARYSADGLFKGSEVRFRSQSSPSASPTDKSSLKSRSHHRKQRLSAASVSVDTSQKRSQVQNTHQIVKNRDTSNMSNTQRSNGGNRASPPSSASVSVVNVNGTTGDVEGIWKHITRAPDLEGYSGVYRRASDYFSRKRRLSGDTLTAAVSQEPLKEIDLNATSRHVGEDFNFDPDFGAGSDSDESPPLSSPQLSPVNSPDITIQVKDAESETFPFLAFFRSNYAHPPPQASNRASESETTKRDLDSMNAALEAFFPGENTRRLSHVPPNGGGGAVLGALSDAVLQEPDKLFQIVMQEKHGTYWDIKDGQHIMYKGSIRLLDLLNEVFDIRSEILVRSYVKSFIRGREREDNPEYIRHFVEETRYKRSAGGEPAKRMTDTQLDISMIDSSMIATSDWSKRDGIWVKCFIVPIPVELFVHRESRNFLLEARVLVSPFKNGTMQRSLVQTSQISISHFYSKRELKIC
ncbi:hypothetical protein EW145_g6356 [Phellinidium pouzarii]|uniref:PH domain-containing protein n=1 Tax=Phellinidium pouzarii TaxID=167371 RepID=A0A4S4KWZ1_9AGAM|nr:hypothetical protein EW145_g6356 [Phellinidium pouzarii]